MQKSPLFGFCLSILLASTAALGGEAARPNVVLILADDLGFTDLSCAGSDLYQTPHIDGLARQSLRFKQAYAAPTCSPSRAAILSGKNPAQLGIVGHGGIRSMGGRDAGNFLVGDEYTIAEALRDAGYTTCHIGKWHVGNKKERTRPEDQGFEAVIASNEAGQPGSYFYPFRDQKRTGGVADIYAVPDLEDRQPGDHLTACLGDEAAKFLAKQKGAKQPFFLNLWYYAPHIPIEALPGRVAKYEKLISQEAQHRHSGYAALVEHLDDSVGRVLRALDENGLAENTIVIFLSDNGGEIRGGITSNAPLRAGKRSVYEGGIRVPMFVRWPGKVKPGVCNAVVAGQDIYPTLLKLTGTKGDERQNKGMDGIDLSELLKRPETRMPERALVWLRYGELVHYPTYKSDPVFGPAAAIRRGDWKMVERYPTPAGLERKFELYNLAEDMGEKNNIAASNPKKLAELRAELAAWQKKINIATYEELALPAFEQVK